LDGYVPPGRGKDPTCLVNNTSPQCRDPERTPLQWTNEAPNAGFTDNVTTPWLPVGASFEVSWIFCFVEHFWF
jgi:alpha-glucosidase